MKVLVTGATGFVGKYLCQELENDGHEVKKFRGDIRKLEDCKANTRGCNAVYHLAAELDEQEKQRLKEVNVKGTENIIEASLKENIEQFVFASSVGVMGNFQGTGTEQTPINPETGYEKTKAQAEKIVWESQEMLPITIIRPALVIGANKEWKKVIQGIEKGFPIIGNGKNHFQMIYVKDLANALAFVLGKQECIGEIFIVSEQEAHSLEEVHAMISKELGKKGKAKKIPKAMALLLSYLDLLKSSFTGKKPFLLPEHIKRMTHNRKYSTEKIRKLGWKPFYSTEQAIKETVQEIMKEKYVE